MGSFFSYPDLSLIVGSVDLDGVVRPKVSGSYAPLISALKYLQRENGYVFTKIFGKGIQRMSDPDIVEESSYHFRRIRRSRRRAVDRLMKVENFSALPVAVQLRRSAAVSVLGVINHMTKPASLRAIEGKIPEGKRALPVKETLSMFMPNRTGRRIESQIPYNDLKGETSMTTEPEPNWRPALNRSGKPRCQRRFLAHCLKKGLTLPFFVTCVDRHDHVGSQVFTKPPAAN